ncbi:NUDIX hydrolase [Bacillus sp. Marseille-Q1617]|uniref:NUDIX hydrolase n=1 Tax=Bacillus sp. Marseille-Q1617 TaxID=2736887 RepID=UPI00158AFAFE|nr:NUDIX hydrolase [Bacillus sp. Marseille-Q1617]
MNEERLSIFDKDYNRLGERPRSEVHEKGYWHETFHCWLAHHDENSGEDYIYFQLRSERKKDYPGLLDITAAGHILSHELMEDGVREIQEELGLDICINELIFTGVIKEELNGGGFTDRELANVFLFTKPVAFEHFSLQVEECSGIFRTSLRDFEHLFFQEKAEIESEGFIVNEDSNKVYISRNISINDFVDHPLSYFHEIIKIVKRQLLEK